MYNKDLYDDIERAERLNQLEPDGYWEEENDIVGLKPEQVKKMLARDNALHDASFQKYKEKHKQKEAEQNEVPDAPVTTKNPLAPVKNPDKANVTGEQFKRSLKDCYWKLKRGYIQKVKKRHPNVEILFGQFESDMYSQKIKVGSRAFVDALEKGFAGIKWNARVLGEGPVAVAQNQLVGGGSKKVTAANTQINSGVGAGCAENIKADVMTIQKALLDLGLLSESDFEQESAVVKSSPTPSVEQEKIGKTIEAITKFQEEVLHWQESDGNISGPGSATLANIHAEHMDSDYVQKRIAMYPVLAAQREAIAGAQMQKKEAAQKVQEPMVEEVDTDTVLTEEPTGKIQISSGAGGKGAKSIKFNLSKENKLVNRINPGGLLNADGASSNHFYQSDTKIERNEFGEIVSKEVSSLFINQNEDSSYSIKYYKKTEKPDSDKPSMTIEELDETVTDFEQLTGYAKEVIRSCSSKKLEGNKLINLPNPSVNDGMIVEPENQTGEILGYAANVIGGAGKGMEQSKSTYRLTKKGKVSPKVYESGWRGGSRARISTHSVAKAGKMLGRGALWLSIILGSLDVYEGYVEDGNEFGKNTQLATGRTIGGISGAALGVTIGAAFGAPFGGIGAIPGAVIGAIIGSVILGIGGAYAGEKAVEEMHKRKR